MEFHRFNISEIRLTPTGDSPHTSPNTTEVTYEESDRRPQQPRQGDTRAIHADDGKESGLKLVKGFRPLGLRSCR